MRILLLILVLLFTAAGCDTPADGSGEAPRDSVAETATAQPAAAPSEEPMTAPASDSIYALSATTLSGEAVELSKYEGKVTLFVNVASQCGYTPQYADLQKLQEELGGDSFTVVGVPSNDFGGQEPGSAEEIQAFCRENYGVSFDMLAKSGTKEGDSELYDRFAAMTGERPSWNFCKYLVSKDGSEARFFASSVKPGGDELRGAIAAFAE